MITQTQAVSANRAAPEDNTQSSTPSSSAPASSGVTKDMFLQLLVAQLRNQDPLKPADGVQFLTQLAQFTQVEQGLAMSGDLAAIRKTLEQLVSQTQAAGSH